jgi:hypothetical protein
MQNRHISRAWIVFIALFLGISAARGDAPARLAFLQPLLPAVTTGKQGNAKAIQTMGNDVERVLPRFADEAKESAWPFEILAASKIMPIYISVRGSLQSTNADVKFSQLKTIAEKSDVRYLVKLKVNDLKSFTGYEGMLRRIIADADIEVTVYDRQTDEYVWQKKATERASRNKYGFPFTPSPNGVREKALLLALQKTLEPFAKGERQKIERPALKVVTIVEKMMEEGKRVTLDVGSNQEVVVGDIFASIESDSKVRVVEIQDKTAVAEVIGGSPKAREVFKSVR